MNALALTEKSCDCISAAYCPYVSNPRVSEEGKQVATFNKELAEEESPGCKTLSWSGSSVPFGK